MGSSGQMPNGGLVIVCGAERGCPDKAGHSADLRSMTDPTALEST